MTYSIKKISLFILIFSAFFILLNSCQKELSEENALPAGTAKGTLTDSTGYCLPDSVHGTFYIGITPGSDTAYIEIAVNVTTAGSYNISTDLENGMQFLGSGVFTDSGLNTVLLKPQGTFLLAEQTLFTISFDSSFCSFTVNVKDTTGTETGGNPGEPVQRDSVGNWEFSNVNGDYFHGYIDTAFIATDSTIWNTGAKMLVLTGFTSATSDSAITIIMYLPNNTIFPGNYSTQALPPNLAAIFTFNFTQTGKPIYDAVADTQSSSNVIYVISNYNATTQIVSGIFSGTANDRVDPGQTEIQLVKGSFQAMVTP